MFYKRGIFEEMKKLFLVLFSLGFCCVAVAQEKIPDNYLYGQYLNMNLDLHFGMEAGISIPVSSLDTTGIIDVSDTINAYIQKVANLYNGDRRLYVFVPEGTYLLEKSVKLVTGVNLIGYGADKTIFNCNTGEGKPCISISPVNEGLTLAAEDTFTLLKDVKRQDKYLALDTSDINKYLYNNRFNRNYIISIVKENDDHLVTSSWANNSVRESGLIKYYEVGKFITPGPISKDTQFYQLSRNFNEFDGDLYASDNYLLVNNYQKDSTKILINPTIFQSGVKCITINRPDTTSSQTSNILVQNASACEIVGVESNYCNFAHIDVRNSIYSLFKRNLIRYGNNYGGGGKAYGIVLQSGSCRNNVVDNVLHHLRHSILLQSGANNNVIFANYSFDPFWEQSGFPADAAGDIVLHGNYPFANIIEANIAQQIVIDDSHGKNGPHNIFHRNWLQGYGIFMSAANGSDSQVFTGNEITNTTFLKGLYLKQDNGHFEYGNWVKGSNQPSSTSGPLQRTVSMDNDYYEYKKRRTMGVPQLTSFLSQDSIPFGEPINAFEKSIPASARSTSLPACAIQDDYYHIVNVHKVEEGKNIWFYPNPSKGEVLIKEPGLLNVFNNLGQKLLELDLTQIQKVDLSAYKGILFLTLETKGHHLLSGRLIVQ